MIVGKSRDFFFSSFVFDDLFSDWPLETMLHWTVGTQKMKHHQQPYLAQFGVHVALAPTTTLTRVDRRNKESQPTRHLSPTHLSPFCLNSQRSVNHPHHHPQQPKLIVSSRRQRRGCKSSNNPWKGTTTSPPWSSWLRMPLTAHRRSVNVQSR